jgi:hypothetical protein
LPNTNPTDGLANLIPHTAGPAVPDRAFPSVTTGAGSPFQLAPRFSVRRIDVHGAFAHGAVPRTNASWGETNVTEVAANPAGTGPPVGVVPPDAVVAGALAVLLAADADGEAALALADVLGELAAPPPVAELAEVAVPHADSTTAASSAPDARAARDARDGVFMMSPRAVDRFLRSLRLWRRRSGVTG